MGARKEEQEGAGGQLLTVGLAVSSFCHSLRGATNMFTPTQKVTHMHSFTPPVSHTPDANKYTHTQTFKKTAPVKTERCVHTLE